MNSVWVITKQGVYRHEIVGVFSSKEMAIEVAVSANNGEIDDYHDFDVVRVSLNSLPSLPIECDNGVTEGISKRKDTRFYGTKNSKAEITKNPAQFYPCDKEKGDC